MQIKIVAAVDWPTDLVKRVVCPAENTEEVELCASKEDWEVAITTKMTHLDGPIIVYLTKS